MSDVKELLKIVSRLRDPKHGCPWDREQTFASIVPHTIEEAYEVADAIARDDLAALKDELGDLLFQVALHARLADEIGAFDFADVAQAIAAKLVRRHPHVFGEARYASAAEQAAAWEQLKAAERGAAGTLDGVSPTLPALSRAVKLQRRAARVGFDWASPEPVLAKVAEELEEVRAELALGADPERLHAELGDLLFACANLGRHLDADPEAALRGASARFERRFRRIEHWLAETGRTPEDASLAEMDALWDRAKAEEKAADKK